jgi:hypothetical protein
MGDQPIMATKKTKQDLEWEARSDVDALIKAQEILDDSGRKTRALAEIHKRNADTKQAEAQLESRTSERAKKLLGGE